MTTPLLKFPSSCLDPISYNKGEIATKDLIPTGEMIGQGFVERVYAYRPNPAQFVVKKSLWVTEREYSIARRLDHENIVKVRALYEKRVPLTLSTFYKLWTDPVWGKALYERLWEKTYSLWSLFWDKMEGNPLSQFSGKNLPSSIVAALLSQAKMASLYLYDQKIYSADLHGENMMITDNSYQLKLIDLGWGFFEEDPEKRGEQVLEMMQRAFLNILSVSSLYKPEEGSIPDARVLFPKLRQP